VLLLSNSPSKDARAACLSAAFGLVVFFAYRLFKKVFLSARGGEIGVEDEKNCHKLVPKEEQQVRRPTVRD
jgi:hypothetical protein